MKKTIKDLIPYVSENFITFPLWEEGDYRPHLHIWLNFETVPEELLLITEIEAYSLISEPEFKNVYINVELHHHEASSVVFHQFQFNTPDRYVVEFGIHDDTEQSETSNYDIQPLIDVAAAVIETLKTKK